MPWNLRLGRAGLRVYRANLAVDFRAGCGGFAATAQLPAKSSNKPGCHGFNALCSSRKKSAFVLPTRSDLIV